MNIATKNEISGTIQNITTKLAVAEISGTIQFRGHGDWIEVQRENEDGEKVGTFYRVHNYGDGQPSAIVIKGKVAKTYPLINGFKVFVEDGDTVQAGTLLAKFPTRLAPTNLKRLTVLAARLGARRGHHSSQS
jgi:hypothetical protein